MADLENVIKLLQEQHEKQMNFLMNQMKGIFAEHKVGNQEQNLSAVSHVTKFEAFDSSSELWRDYLDRFKTFLEANSVSADKRSQVFLTNQSTAIYKFISNLASQQTPSKNVNDLTMEEIIKFMDAQFNPKYFVVRERFRFWSDIRRKPGENIQELASRIRNEAATCDFPAIKDPLDESLKTKFLCSVGNEAILKAIFKIPADELNFSKAIQIAQDVEAAAKAAKETVHGSSIPLAPVQKMDLKFKKAQTKSNVCEGCGRSNHLRKECYYRNSICHKCNKRGHLKSMCKSQKDLKYHSVKDIHSEENIVRSIKSVSHKSIPPLKQNIYFNVANNTKVEFEIDCGAEDTICSTETWKLLGKPKLSPVSVEYHVANGEKLKVLGQFQCMASLRKKIDHRKLTMIVADVSGLNLLGRKAMVLFELTDLTDYFKPYMNRETKAVQILSNQTAGAMQKACEQLCQEFPEIFEKELGCLKDFELDIKFKEDTKPKFCKPRPVPYAIQDELNQAYDAGIKRGVWSTSQFNEYGTPVVPIRKASVNGKKAKLRVCGDYSVTVNSQLEIPRQPIPLPEDLIRKLGGGYYFTKVDLADAYNQIKLSPESRKRLALSTHRGVLLQERLPFGISSAPGYFQQIMEQLTRDLRGVAVYLDDILVSGKDAQEHLENLRTLFKRLKDKGLRCNRDKCSFAQSTVEYLGHTLSREGVSKGSRVDALLKMPPPTNVSSLRSFLGSVQFYGKFLPPNLSTITEPLHRLTRKDEEWHWGTDQQKAFKKLKDLLCEDNVLVHYDPSVSIGISCDASEVGIGGVLFHRYHDGSERPIANVSKTLTDCQKRYSQIQKEALAVIFALKKFHQFLYGRKFILVTDHKPLLSLFGPSKETPVMAANRLARWALTLSQYNYSIEYRNTKNHGNADALSRLPSGPDSGFDREEVEDDSDTVCTIKTISQQLEPKDINFLVKETARDQLLSQVIRFVKEGWPQKISDELQDFKKLEDSLVVSNGCLFYGARVVIPVRLWSMVLKLLHLGHFGMQRMKQLARTAVYWPRMDADIEKLCRTCTACGEFQKKPTKPPVHPWMLPEKPWSRIHLDHAVNFMGRNWLVVIDAFSKYTCIHPVASLSAQATMQMLEQDFSHFGYPHTLVTDNAASFHSEEFKAYCLERGIIHLTGAPYHPATNGLAERIIQTFKQSLKKSDKPPLVALQDFLIQYRRTPLSLGFSPSELLNGRQIRTRLDALVPCPAYIAQGQQSKGSSSIKDKVLVSKLCHQYQVGDFCYALHFGAKQDKDRRWVPAVVTKVLGPRSVNVRVEPHGPVWRRHIEQLQPRHTSPEDLEPGEDFPLHITSKADIGASNREVPESQLENTLMETGENKRSSRTPKHKSIKKNPRQPNGDEFGRHNLRRSKRNR